MAEQHERLLVKAPDIPSPYEALGVARAATVDESEWGRSVHCCLSSASLCDSSSIVQAKGAGDPPR